MKVRMTINIITTAVNFRNIKFRPEEFQEILLDKEIIIIFLYFLSVSWKRHVMEFLEKKVVHIAYIQAIKMYAQGGHS
ncbi:putative RNA methyltransferase [Trifolium repens]|nr:putative RNA methyltransferase [Trifolium repens]